MLADQFDGVRAKTSLFAELSPRGLARILADIDTALRKLPRARDVGALERQHEALGVRDDRDDAGAELVARHGGDGCRLLGRVA